MNESIRCTGGVIFTEEKLSKCHFVPNPQIPQTSLGLNMGLHSDRLMTDCLSHEIKYIFECMLHNNINGPQIVRPFMYSLLQFIFEGTPISHPLLSEENKTKPLSQQLVAFHCYASLFSNNNTRKINNR